MKIWNDHLINARRKENVCVQTPAYFRSSLSVIEFLLKKYIVSLSISTYWVSYTVYR